MKKKNGEISIWAQVVTFAMLWLIVLKFSNISLSSQFQALWKLPDVVAYYTILYQIFSKWLWRMKIFQGWLVKFPDLEGTWKGSLQTTWVDKNGKTPGPITMILVIKQSFNEITCVMYTAESSSYSSATSLEEIDNTDNWMLNYMYTNKPDPTIRDRSNVHDGSAVLTVSKDPKLTLSGEYWTNRKTTGSMKLTYHSKDLLDRFPEY